MDVNVGNSPKAQMPHASRSKYLGKILGNRRSEFVTNAEISHFVTSVSPRFSRVSDGNTWVVCWKRSQQACPSRWVFEQLEEHTSGQSRYYLECECLLALSSDTEKLQRAAKDRHRRRSCVGFQATSVGAKKLCGKKLLLVHLRGVLCKFRLFKVRLLEPELPSDCFSGPSCRVLYCTHEPRDCHLWSSLLFLSDLKQIVQPHQFSRALWPQDYGILIRNSGHYFLWFPSCP